MATMMGNKTSTENTILTRDFSDERGDKYWAKFSSKPFEAGVSRYAFKGVLRGSGPKKEAPCVVKVYKEEYAEKFDDWMPDLYASIQAKEFAKTFTEYVLPSLDLQKTISIECIIPMLAEVDETTMTSSQSNRRKNKSIDRKEYVAIEEYLQGNYVKFNSNAGYENKNLSGVMTAFTHWSWEYSGRKMMLCDLQGMYLNPF